MKINLKKIMIGYLLFFFIFMLIYCSLKKPGPTGEWDDYSLPVASILNDHNFSISDQDVKAYKAIYPDWASYIDSYSLSGYSTKDGSGQMAWYFPTYSIACIPFTLLLTVLKLPAIYAFPYTNLTVLMIALIMVFFCLNTSDRRKALLIAALSVNPIIYYIFWTSAEVFIYSMLIMGLVSWCNKWYKRAAVFVSIAGMLNPTIMSIGIVMLLEYALKLLKEKKKEDTWAMYIKKKYAEILKYGCCYIIGIVPMIYNYYNIGHINLTASYSGFTHGPETTILRFWSYLFDLNYGILPYYFVIFCVAILMIIPAIIRKQWSYLKWVATFLINVALYSVMVHINCGMTGISRYNSWGALLLIFAVIMFYDKIIEAKSIIKGIGIALSTGVLITGIIVSQYGYCLASNTGSYIWMTPIAAWVLDKAPSLYNPLYSTFNSRTIHQDGGYIYETPVIYVADDGYVRKILAKKENKEQLLQEYSSLNGNNDWFVAKVEKLGESESYISVPKKYEVVKANVYILGNPITFTSEGYNADPYVVTGLSGIEDWGTWTDGKEFVMRFKTSSDCDVIKADINASVYNNVQDITVLVNDEVVYTNGEYTGGNIQFNFGNPGPNQIIEVKVEIPNAISPVEFGYSDSRILGLGISSIIFSE